MGVCIDRDLDAADAPGRSALSRAARDRAWAGSLHHHGQPIGTVWIVSHNFEKRFDKEDERNVRVLARFASAAWDLWKACETTLDTNRRKDGFLAILGHELRNPLAATTAAAAILRERLKDDASAIRATDVIVRQCRRMSRLVEDLLDVARIGHGKMQLEQQRLDLRAVITEAIDERRVQIERRGQHVTTALGEAAVWVYADPVRLSQVISNLVDNAAKYTPNARTHPRRGQSRRVKCTLMCTTAALAWPPTRWSTCSPFSQLFTESRNASAGGLGIGLALVKASSSCTEVRWRR